MAGPAPSAESQRLVEDREGKARWKRWGPYLSERQWGTVREDYSAGGDAWNYFPHDDARSRAYRWGEDGIAGFSDETQRICLALAVWNGNDPILKERLFGLTNGEGNHGEDVKELYYYLDATPTHSWLRMLYKYPQRAYPYEQLLRENRRRTRLQPEYEILDTGVFNEGRYFDIFVDYAKAGPEDIVWRITAHNRGPEPADLHLLPHVWFRNTWEWTENAPRPLLGADDDRTIFIDLTPKRRYSMTFEGEPTLLFTENETNVARLFLEKKDGHFKDAFHDFVIHDKHDAINPARQGTKAAAWYRCTLQPGETWAVTARLTATGVAPIGTAEETLRVRLAEADEFYDCLQADMDDPDAKVVQRQAASGVIWTKQFYHYDVPVWLDGDPTQPPPPKGRCKGRNSDWLHLNNADIVSMPDKWEYPWYAAWDLAFHCIPFGLLDPDFAKEQLVLMTREWYMHPNGQIPAYEWNFGDVNPPVHAWATWRVFQIDRRRRGDGGDVAFLERVFHKLLLNFTWWVNRKDATGRNVFQGGFLGLDNIGVFDRSAPLPTGGYINQADGTAWMAMYSLNLMRIALELAQHNPVYEDIATKFFEHFLHIAEAMTAMGGNPGMRNCECETGVGLWDEIDQFYYDELILPDGRVQELRVRSMVGLIPLFAVETLEPAVLDKLPGFKRRLEWVLKYRPELAALVSRWHEPGTGERRLLSLLRGHRIKMLLKRMLDENEFLSPFGVRSLSRFHLAKPYTFRSDGQTISVSYVPGDSDSGLFGGNSNWRGPIWMPVNFLIIESLQKFHHYYGDEFKVECPTGSGNFMTLLEVADELTRRLGRLFLKDEKGNRPLHGPDAPWQQDPHFQDYVPFYEFFDGDTGKGLGAAHQTGWTSLIAKLLHPRRGEPPFVK